MSRGRGVVVDKNKRLFNEVQIKHGILLSFETIFFFCDRKPKCFSFWKRFVVLSLRHLHILTFFFSYLFVMTWKWNTCNANLSNAMGILDGTQLIQTLLYHRSHRRTILLFQQITVCCFWTKLPFPAFVSEPGFLLQVTWWFCTYPAELYWWWGWLLWRGLMWGITISESGLGAHSETYTGKYHWMHWCYIFRFIFCFYLCLHISYFQVI